MSELHQKLDELFRLVCSAGSPPVPERFLITEVGPKDYKDAHPVIDTSKLMPEQEYVDRFSHLVGAGYPWLNLSYYGLLGGVGLVVVELPAAAPTPGTRQPRTSVNYSGPVKAVRDAGWDVTGYVVLAGDVPDPPVSEKP